MIITYKTYLRQNTILRLMVGSGAIKDGRLKLVSIPDESFLDVMRKRREQLQERNRQVAKQLENLKKEKESLIKRQSEPS